MGKNINHFISWRSYSNLAGFFLTILLMLLLIVPPDVKATQCDCLPEFEVDAEGPGTCSVIKNDANWCKIKFRNSDFSGSNQLPEGLSQMLRRLELPVYAVDLSAWFLKEVPPEEWDKEVSWKFFALLVYALWDRTPERLKEIKNILINEIDPKLFLSAVTGEGKQLKAGRYTLDAARGCLLLIDGHFSVMIRTRFAYPDRRICTK